MNVLLKLVTVALWFLLLPGWAYARGGGGCFPAGTMICTPGGEIPIERIKVGDWVTAIKKDGRPVRVKVRQTHVTFAPVVIVSTDDKSLRTTAEHPLCLAGGTCRSVNELGPEDKLLFWRENETVLSPVTYLKSTIAAEEVVYNLTVDWPHTFIADGFVVHNKGGGGGGFGGGGFSGGGGGGGGHSSYGGGGSSHNNNETPRSNQKFSYEGVAIIICALGGWFVILIILYVIAKNKEKDVNLDYVFSLSDVQKKSGKTLKLLEFLARQDPVVAPDALRKQTETTFLTLQKCWQARDYGPMKPLMMGYLYANHCRQLQQMVNNHEINMIDQVRIDRVDLVNIRYPFKENQREFTALVTATARDYYMDDRTQKWLRGDKQSVQFQEFWTFQYMDKAWLLREIEQTRESDVLKEDNFFEQFTDTGVKQIYGDEAAKEGSAGPWLEKTTQTKETRIERMLSFLYQTDKLWNRLSMLETTRRVFLEMMAAWESGNPADIPDSDFSPEITADFRQKMAENKRQGTTLEFRNLCNRKVELILIRNFADHAKDEFVARVRAHAQKIVRRNSQIVHQDEDVTPFEQYLTFGRRENKWKLKEILSPETGQKALAEENLDQDSSPQQVQWYYQQKRAL